MAFKKRPILLYKLRLEPGDWVNYLRMDEETYLELFNSVAPLIKNRTLGWDKVFPLMNIWQLHWDSLLRVETTRIWNFQLRYPPKLYKVYLKPERHCKIPSWLHDERPHMYRVARWRSKPTGKIKLGQIFWNDGHHDGFSAHTDRNECDRLARSANLMKTKVVCGAL